MWPNPQFSADLVTFTEEILERTLTQICKSVNIFLHENNMLKTTETPFGF